MNEQTRGVIFNNHVKSRSFRQFRQIYNSFRWKATRVFYCLPIYIRLIIKKLFFLLNYSFQETTKKVPVIHRTEDDPITSHFSNSFSSNSPCGGYPVVTQPTIRLAEVTVVFLLIVYTNIRIFQDTTKLRPRGQCFGILTRNSFII